MKYRHLGSTGIRVSQLCLGTLMFGSWGNRSATDSIAILNRAMEAGVNYIDTADSYSRGESEEIVGKALAMSGRRDRVVLATKVHSPMGADPNSRGNSRRWIHQAVDNSLRRLGTDWIDIYQVHRPDPHTDIDETLGALTDLVRAGKIRYLGSSTFPAHHIVEAQWTAERRHRERFVCEQPPYSLLAREIEADVLPTCQKYGMGTATWSPLAGGWLTGRYRKGQDIDTTGRAGRWAKRYDLSTEANQRKLDAVEQLAHLAEESGISLIHLALAFVTEHPGVTSAIIGPRTMEQLESQLGAVNVRLTQDVLDRIDAIVPPGRTLNPEDGGWTPTELTTAALRRRGH
ncbi:aldo/keto reductase [Kitasatospora sp. NPDC051984]|uniref:aldo/keto reductase n=1 Tax=Kitasatospora sp. NPDC051984 TaxID=3364059 RepID=UPI0037CBD561